MNIIIESQYTKRKKSLPKNSNKINTQNIAKKLKFIKSSTKNKYLAASKRNKYSTWKIKEEESYSNIESVNESQNNAREKNILNWSIITPSDFSRNTSHACYGNTNSKYFDCQLVLPLSRSKQSRNTVNRLGDFNTSNYYKKSHKNLTAKFPSKRELRRNFRSHQHSRKGRYPKINSFLQSSIELKKVKDKVKINTIINKTIEYL